MSGLGWKTATAPMAATGWSSKTGVQVSPPLTDFQTPPVAAPTNTTAGLASTASRSAIRPLIPAGPMARAFIPASSSGSIPPPDTGVAHSRIISTVNITAGSGEPFLWRMISSSRTARAAARRRPVIVVLDSIEMNDMVPSIIPAAPARVNPPERRPNRYQNSQALPHVCGAS